MCIAQDWRCLLLPQSSVYIPVEIYSLAASVCVKLQREAGSLITGSCLFKVVGSTFLLSASVSPSRTFFCALRTDAAANSSSLRLTLLEPCLFINSLPLYAYIYCCCLLYISIYCGVSLYLLCCLSLFIVLSLSIYCAVSVSLYLLCCLRLSIVLSLSLSISLCLFMLSLTLFRLSLCILMLCLYLG